MKQELIRIALRLCYGNEWSELLSHKVKALIISRKYNAARGKKPIVISLSNNIWAKAGLCDRLKGMMGIYKICKELGLQYKIGHYNPFDLSDYLRPHEVNWLICEDDIDMDLHNVKIIEWCPIGNSLTGRKGVVDVNFTHDHLYKWIEEASNTGKKQIHIYGNSYAITDDDIHTLFHELFIPTEELQRQIEWNKIQIGGPYVSVSTRFQNLLGDFYEGDKYGTLETEEIKGIYINRCLEKVEEIHKQHPDKRVLVTSDSLRFLTAANNLSYTHVIPGEVVHMKYTTNASHVVYQKSFVDLLTIADAQKVYFIATGKMYRNSGFARTGACIHNRAYESIYF